MSDLVNEIRAEVAARENNPDFYDEGLTKLYAKAADALESQEKRIAELERELAEAKEAVATQNEVVLVSLRKAANARLAAIEEAVKAAENASIKDGRFEIAAAIRNLARET